MNLAGKKTAGGEIPAINPNYSIEIFIIDTKPLSTETTPSGVIVVWAVNAVGDRALTYLCPKCTNFFPPGYEQLVHAETKAEYVKCSSCGELIPDMMLQTSYGFRCNLKKVAETAAYLYDRSMRNASIRLRRFKDEKSYRDVISCVRTVEYTDLLSNARSGQAQEWVDYPKERLQKDLESGANIVDTIHTFLTV